MQNVILLAGIILGLGFIFGKITDHFKLTTVVGYIITGIILGPVFHLIKISSTTTEIVVGFVLALVAFIIGGNFTINFLRRLGKATGIILVSQALATAIFTGIGIYLWTNNLLTALILGSLAVATAPAGTIAVIQSHHVRNRVSKIITAIVGLDDGIAIIIFVVALSIVKTILGGNLSILGSIYKVTWEIGGAVILGIITGIISSQLAKRIRTEESILITALVSILICAGLAKIAGVSLILSEMFLGASLVNLAPGISRSYFEVIEKLLPLFFVLFFVTAGLNLRLDLLIKSGGIGLIYILCRIIGKIVGAAGGAKLAKAKPVVQKYLGFALLSQAGVAIGLAAIASHELSILGSSGQYLGTLALTTITATTVIFEIIGPIGVRFTLTQIKKC